MSFSVALATFLTQSCPVVPRDAVTTSMYLVKSSLAKTGALEATAPVKDYKLLPERTSIKTECDYRQNFPPGYLPIMYNNYFPSSTVTLPG